VRWRDPERLEVPGNPLARASTAGSSEEIGALGRAQAKSDKEKSELRAQFAREQANHAKKQEAMKRKIAALRRQLGEEAAARGSWDSSSDVTKRNLPIAQIG
jgi:hypothetical protein